MGLPPIVTSRPGADVSTERNAEAEAVRFLYCQVPAAATLPPIKRIIPIHRDSRATRCFCPGVRAGRSRLTSFWEAAPVSEANAASPPSAESGLLTMLDERPDLKNTF